MGQNQDVLRHQIIHFPMNSGVSERVNKWAQRCKAKRAVWNKQISERCERTSEQTSEWPSTYIPILGCLEPLWTRTNFRAWRLERVGWCLEGRITGGNKVKQLQERQQTPSKTLDACSYYQFSMSRLFTLIAANEVLLVVSDIRGLIDIQLNLVYHS